MKASNVATPKDQFINARISEGRTLSDANDMWQQMHPDGGSPPSRRMSNRAFVASIPENATSETIGTRLLDALASSVGNRDLASEADRLWPATWAHPNDPKSFYNRSIGETFAWNSGESGSVLAPAMWAMFGETEEDYSLRAKRQRTLRMLERAVGSGR